MITQDDLRHGISAFLSQKDITPNDCVKLAAYITIQNHLYPQEQEEERQAEPMPISVSGDSPLRSAIRGKPQEELLAIADELMETLEVLQPRLYDAVMRKISEI